MSEPRRPWVLTPALAGLFALLVTQAHVHTNRPSVRNETEARNRFVANPFPGKVVEFGVVVYEGPIDVNPTLERIRSGQKIEHRNEGGIFWNREKRLPVQMDPEYYREFIHWDEDLNIKLKGRITFPGPQRLVIGKQGEIYYSGDHYISWKRLDKVE